MFDRMFSSAGYKTFGAKFGEVGFTVFLMWGAMLVVVGLFKVIGLIASIDFNTNLPLLGITANYLLHYSTFDQALAVSVAAVLGVIFSAVAAPLWEEVVFRGPCKALSDKDGKLKPEFLFIVLGWSFIAFGLGHGHLYFSVLLQGVGGLFLARLWFRNGPSSRASYWSCVAAHSLYNISVIIIVWMSGS